MNYVDNTRKAVERKEKKLPPSETIRCPREEKKKKGAGVARVKS